MNFKTQGQTFFLLRSTSASSSDLFRSLSPPQVNDLRKELDCRSLSSKGLKSQLIARLTKQLKVEEQVEEAKEPEKPEVKVPEEEEPPQEEDKEVCWGGLLDPINAQPL